MFGNNPPFEKGNIEIGKGGSYQKENDRLDDHLSKAIEAHVKSQGYKLTPEIALHHLSAIHAVAQIRNGEANPYTMVGGSEAMDYVDKHYPVEMTTVRKAQKLMKTPGNEADINKMFNLMEGVTDGMTTAQAMKDMKNRLGKVSTSRSW